ncbi:MAG: response regulator transcription factor [Acidimicrobiales bacterium]
MAQGTILVVDDDPGIVKLLQVNFEMEGYDVITASNGEDGVRRAGADHPALMVLDVMMPGMDGLEAARRVRAAPDTATLPIILLSAKAQAPDIHAGQLVADEYVTKPFDPLELLDRVARLIASRGQALP